MCGGIPAPVVGVVGNCGTNVADSAPDVFWRSDEPGLGQAAANTSISPANARSTAILTVPSGASVTHADLYWGGVVSGGDNVVTIDRPGGFAADVLAAQTYLGSNNAYASVADVTGLVQANGSGTYRIGGVDTAALANVFDNVQFAGWWMVVLYERADLPLRNLAVFDGLDEVVNGSPQNVSLTGLSVPISGYTGALTVVTFEGDNAIAGDQLLFNGAAMSNALNPVNNFFNGTRSLFGAAQSVVGDLPQLTGGAGSMAGIDIDVVDVTANLTPGLTTAPIVATSVGDVYHLATFVTSISAFEPDFGVSSSKTAVDLNGGALLPGDIVEFTLVVSNDGNDNAVNTTISDPLPGGLGLVSGSLQVTNGPNTGAKTDLEGDDQCEFVAGISSVACRLGTGANGAQGGQLDFGTSTTVVFRASVDAGTLGTITNVATVSATAAIGGGTVTFEIGANVFVDQCATDADCSSVSATPYCQTATTPMVCVACLVDANCPGTRPVCDPAMQACVCIATGGPEECNDRDDDCNGTVDDGFDIGAACSVGVGACSTSGLTICDGTMAATCEAVPGIPVTEVCGDQVDDDCDGELDNGCEADGGVSDGDGGVADAGPAGGSHAGVDPGESGGCCQVGSGTPTLAWMFELFLVGLLLTRRRQRVTRGAQD